MQMKVFEKQILGTLRYVSTLYTCDTVRVVTIHSLLAAYLYNVIAQVTAWHRSLKITA